MSEKRLRLVQNWGRTDSGVFLEPLGDNFDTTIVAKMGSGRMSEFETLLEGLGFVLLVS